MTEESLTARNRINQRNFRARRQNYIKELEERIRKHESDGVQATIEIQAAARQVTDQNSKLRLLLTQRFGMSDHEISLYLNDSQQLQHQSLPNGLTPHYPSNSVPKPRVSVESQQLATNESRHFDLYHSSSRAHFDSALGLASLHTYSPTHNSQPWAQQTLPVSNDSSDSPHQDTDVKPSPPDAKVPISPTDSLVESSNPSTPVEHNHVDDSNTAHTKPNQPSKSCCGSNTSACTPSSLNSRLTGMIRPNDERTCEEAARIIASMRGNNGSPEEVMLELGCPEGDAKCSVKNVEVFQLMDRG